MPAATLPLTRVRLYETGVGYFERSGAMPAGETSLPVPAEHLDDALKTLVVLSGDVKVTGLAFSSSVSRDMANKPAGLARGRRRPHRPDALARAASAPLHRSTVVDGDVEKLRLTSSRRSRRRSSSRRAATKRELGKL